MQLRSNHKRAAFLKPLAILFLLAFSLSAGAQLTYDLERSARAALDTLYASSPAASSLGAKAKAVLVFPDVRESSFDMARAGDGVLFIGGSVAGYYSMGGVLEAGAESYSYAMFIMSHAALDRLSDSTVFFDRSPDPDVVVVEIGAMRRLPAVRPTT